MAFGLHAFITLVPTLINHVSYGTHVAVNDLGTLSELTRSLAPYARMLPFDAEAGGALVECPLRLTLGTLLARSDDPREVAHFLSAEENPSRPVWGPEGEPRTLTYAPPPASLVLHWHMPSLTCRSAQEALGWLLNWGPCIPYEFECRGKPERC